MRVDVYQVGVLVLLLASCSPQPHLSDLFDPIHLKTRQRLDFIESAPIVVVGRVRSVPSIGGVRSAARLPEMKIELTRISIDVENVLTGEVSGSELEFYYFVFSARNHRDLGVPAYFPVLGERRVFFLKSEAGVIRSVGDVTNCTLRVASGSHIGFKRPANSSLGQTISLILLTPGEKCDAEVFRAQIAQAFFIATALSTESYALSLLEKLLRDNNEAVRNEAARILASLQPPH